MAALGLYALPAHAADDGQASLITGLGQTFGVIPTNDPRIDYRERGKLVVPPKKVLPPPVDSAARGDGAWPRDVEVVREKKQKKLEEGGVSAFQMALPAFQLFNAGDDVKVTTSSFDGHGPSCRHPDPQTGECPGTPKASIEWNPLTWVGIQKKAPVVLGAEPERQNLVDPPKGLRAPAEGAGVKVED